MKILLSALLILSSSFAFATQMEQPVGKFIPSQCSTSKGKVMVCFGIYQGVRADYLSITPNDRSSTGKVYVITERTPVNGGINPQAGAERIIFRDRNGNSGSAAIRYTRGVNGQTVLTSISGYLPNGSAFSASDFKSVIK